MIKLTIDEIREMYLKEVGKAEGLALGEAKGITEKTIEFPRDMLLDDEPIEKILKYTNLSHDEILEIKEGLTNS